MAQVATWNPSILGACDHLLVGQVVCSSPPGGAWISPPASEIPDSSEGPVRGGPGSTASLPIIGDASAVFADMLQEGISSDCNRWIVANNTQAACWKLANDAKISTQRLFALNPVLGTAGEFCATRVWLGYYFCIATPGDGTSPSSTKPITTPETGASCWSIANGAGVDLANFYKWNTGLGSNGENCNTQIWLQYYYCVGVATTTSNAPTTTSKAPTTTSSAPKPARTQAGFPSNCTKWVEAKDGDSCWAISNANGVDTNLFYKLNPVLGEGGANCGTQIWPTYSYCLAT
ncbi:hypothetical protein BKA63DRAFT_488368 [Paraphoma chrysanthemicola]|nr:hypothetical protein BKA63DRAFT_488368 [Paraphoma chrysanthemicola]